MIHFGLATIQFMGPPFQRLPDTLEELRHHTHGIHPSGSDFNLRRVGAMCKCAHKKTVSPRSERRERKSSDAVRRRRRVW